MKKPATPQVNPPLSAQERKWMKERKWVWLNFDEPPITQPGPNSSEWLKDTFESTHTLDLAEAVRDAYALAEMLGNTLHPKTRPKK